jgi:hypothetical protein
MVPEASTYELSSCYNVSVECRSTGMVAKIQTTKLFNGKVNTNYRNVKNLKPIIYAKIIISMKGEDDN